MVKVFQWKIAKWPSATKGKKQEVALFFGDDKFFNLMNL